MKTENMKTSIAATFIWIGLVCGISFLEAWLKFQAPGITVPLGLGIGKLVFGALNKIEWMLAVLILANVLFVKRNLLKAENFAFYIPIILLLLQSLWLLPALDLRATLHIHGTPPPPSNHHIIFVAIELTKVFCLAIFGTSLLKSLQNK